jgi:aspartate racemase
MKTAGIIGGIGPPSTIEYYRLIIASYREQKQDGSYPHLLINSIASTVRAKPASEPNVSFTAEAS